MNGIEVNEVYKHFTLGAKVTQVLKGCSWTANSGEVTGLLGPNGSGKSTMLQILCGNLNFDEGSISLLNNHHTPEIARNMCAWLPEHPYLSPSSKAKDVLKEYALFDGVSSKIIQQRISDVEKTFPISHFLNQPCATLSQGQSSLLSLSRLMMIQRPIILLDEPTASLDQDTALLVRSWMASLADQGKVVLISSHLNDDKMMCQKIVQLHNGKTQEGSL